MQSNRETTLEVDNVSHIYSGAATRTPTLADVSMTVDKGSFVSIVGPSGCGKSTLLKIVAGFLPPTNGQVKIDGESPDVARRRHDLGFVFQSPVLLPWRSALHNVALIGQLTGVDRRTRLARARESLELVGLAGWEHSRPVELSGGMQQRVSIARALAYGARVILMDEPFGALDALTRDRMGSELLRIWSNIGATIIFVTHDVAEAVYLSDTVVTMAAHPGRIRNVHHIGIPRPRTAEARLTDEFVEYERLLLKDLTSED